MSDRMTVDLDIPPSAKERAEAISKHVASLASQIERAIKFQQEIIIAAEKEIQRLRGLRLP